MLGRENPSKLYQWAAHCMSGLSKPVFDVGHISPIKYFFAVAFILGVLFAFISQGDQPERLFISTFTQWQLQTGLPIALLITSHMLLGRFTKFERLNPWLQLIVSGFFGALIFSPFALLLDYAFGQNQFLQQQWHWQLFDELGGVGPPVLISWIAMNAPWILGYRIKQVDLSVGSEQQAMEAKPAEEGIPTDAPLFKMLPSHIGTDVVFLKAELHYIEVNTTQGQALILYNLKDAMHELMHLPGLQTHRSYWVNLHHHKTFKKQGRQGVLIMNGGHEIPVSRTQMKAVGEACNS